MATTLDPDVVLDPDAPGPPISVPDSGDTGEGGKLKMIVQLVKKCLGVKDIAAMRLSLPASLLEPVPNLEYWQYLDRPDLFSAINDSEDVFERMLAVLRFAFTKDLKFVHGKVCKPYNSVLGEHFRSHWDVIPIAYSPDPTQAPIANLYTGPAAASIIAFSDNMSIKSGKSSRSNISLLSHMNRSPSTAATSLAEPLGAMMSNLSLAEADDGPEDATRVRVVYTTEQVSHHPPISAYFAACPARSLELSGIDQIAAKVATTTLRVAPGAFNKGLFIDITGGHGKGEAYNITHPVAAVNGILRGSFYVTVGEHSIITATGGTGKYKLRTLVEYKDESWIGKAHFLVEGVIHIYDENETVHKEWTKVKHVPQPRIVATFDGSWRQRIRWKRVGVFNPSQLDAIPATGEYATLLDLSTLKVIPKSVRPLEKQLPHESQKLWEKVTDKLIKKEFGDATKEKVAIEQKQRDEAAERKRKGLEFIPRYFEKNIDSGKPKLTAEGRKAVEEELAEPSPYCIEGSENAVLAP